GNTDGDARRALAPWEPAPSPPRDAPPRRRRPERARASRRSLRAAVDRHVDRESRGRLTLPRLSRVPLGHRLPAPRLPDRAAPAPLTRSAGGGPEGSARARGRARLLEPQSLHRGVPARVLRGPLGVPLGGDVRACAVPGTPAHLRTGFPSPQTGGRGSG